MVSYVREAATVSSRHRYPLRSRINQCLSINRKTASPQRRRSRSCSIKKLPVPLLSGQNRGLPRSCLRQNRPKSLDSSASNSRKLVRFRQPRRKLSRHPLENSSRAMSARARSLSVASRCSSGNESLTSRQIDLRKRRAFLARIRTQEPDIDKKCTIRRTESDEVLIRQKRKVLARKTLLKNQTAIRSIRRIEGSAIGKGGFGEVSGWNLERRDGTIQRVAVKSFDAADGGLKLARAEASVMAVFESLLAVRMLLWFVPHKPVSFPADFPTPAIIMPLFETRNCISPSLHNLVFEHKIIRPTMGWILNTLIQISVAVSKLHAAGWAHGDLHGGNIIVQNRKVILIDYSKANRKNRPYVYSLDPSINWVERLDWIEPLAVMGQDCCSRAGDIWSLGKLVEALLSACLSDEKPLRPKEKQHQTRLNAFVHLAFHKRQFRPDAKFLIEVLRSKAFSSLNICSCQPDCGMLQKT